MAMMFGCYVVISLAGGLTFNTALIALPKLIDERVGQGMTLVLIGSLATAIFLCGALAQLAVGRLIERYPPHLLFVCVVTVQFLGIVAAAYASGPALIAALAVAMGGIYAQVTVGDIVIARYTADAWRGRVYSVRYFLTFITSGIAVQLIAQLYSPRRLRSRAERDRADGLRDADRGLHHGARRQRRRAGLPPRRSSRRSRASRSPASHQCAVIAGLDPAIPIPRRHPRVFNRSPLLGTCLMIGITGSSPVMTE